MAIDFTRLKNMHQQRQAQQKADPIKRSGDIKYYELPKETHQVILRVLPPRPNQAAPGRYTRKHFKLPGNKFSDCLLSFGMDCPVCNIIRDYQHKVDTQDQQAVEQALIPVLVIQDIKHPEINPRIPVVMRSNGNLLEWLITQILDPAIGDVTDAYAGHNLLLQRIGHGKKFNRSFALSKTAIGSTHQEINSILEAIPDVDKLVRKPTDDSITQLRKLAMELRDVYENMVMGIMNGTMQRQASGQTPDYTGVQTNSPYDVPALHTSNSADALNAAVAAPSSHAMPQSNPPLAPSAQIQQYNPPLAPSAQIQQYNPPLAPPVTQTPVVMASAYTPASAPLSFPPAGDRGGIVPNSSVSSHATLSQPQVASSSVAVNTNNVSRLDGDPVCFGDRNKFATTMANATTADFERCALCRAEFRCAESTRR